MLECQSNYQGEAPNPTQNKSFESARLVLGPESKKKKGIPEPA
jgi:hypothetical protein